MAQYQEGQYLQGSDGRMYVVRNGVPVTAGPQALVQNPKLPGELTGQSLTNQLDQAKVDMTPDQKAELHQNVIAKERENMQFVGDPSKHGPDYLNSIPPQYANYRNIIPMIAQNQVQVGNVARSNNEAKLLIAGAKQFNPQYDPSLASVRSKAIQDYTGNGDASVKIQALDRAAQALSLLKGYSDKMGGPNTGYSPLNSLIARNQQDTGDRLLAAKGFDTLLPEAMGQLNTVLAGSTTVSGMNEIKQGLDPHASQAERNAAFQAFGHALINAAQNLKEGWNSAYGGTAAPPKWISPDNAAFLEKLTGSPSGSLQANEWHSLPGLNPDGSQSQHMGPQPASPPTPTNAQLPGAGMTLNGGQPTKAVVDPVLKAASGRIGSMLASGTPDGQILKFMQDSGINPSDTNIGQALQFRQTPDFTRWQQGHQGESYPIGPDFYTRQVPVTASQQLFNKAVDTGVGGALASIPVAAGNAIAGNRGAQLIGAINGDPEMAQTGMDLLRQNHPFASVGGDVLGQGLLEASVGRIPGAQALMAGTWGRRGADALYGAYNGSSDPNNPIGGAVTGALGGALGGMAFRGAQSGIGKAFSGVQNKALQYLDNAGVPLTIGQIGRGSDNMAGHIAGGIEDRLAGLPGFDAVIGAARQRGDEGFNQAAFSQAGVQNGLTGGPALAEVGNLKNQAYNFLNPLKMPVDAQFSGTNAGIRASIPNMPGFGDEVGKTLNQIDKISTVDPATGLPSITGQDWQSALSDIRGNKASITGAPFARQASSAMGNMDNNLLNLAARQGPEGTVGALNNANALNAQFNTLSSALDNGQAQKAGQIFSPLQLDNASRINTRKYGGRLASLTGENRPFYDLTQAGLQVMPNLTPDSGTAGRFWMVPLMSSALGAGAGALGGEAEGGDKGHDAGIGAEYGAALGLAALGPYSKTGQNLIQKALLADRSARAQKIGSFLQNTVVPSGMFGGGMSPAGATGSALYRSLYQYPYSDPYGQLQAGQ